MARERKRRERERGREGTHTPQYFLHNFHDIMMGKQITELECVGLSVNVGVSVRV